MSTPAVSASNAYSFASIRAVNAHEKPIVQRPLFTGRYTIGKPDNEVSYVSSLPLGCIAGAGTILPGTPVLSKEDSDKVIAKSQAASKQAEKEYWKTHRTADEKARINANAKEFDDFEKMKNERAEAIRMRNMFKDLAKRSAAASNLRSISIPIAKPFAQSTSDQQSSSVDDVKERAAQVRALVRRNATVSISRTPDLTTTSQTSFQPIVQTASSPQASSTTQIGRFSVINISRCD